MITRRNFLKQTIFIATLPPLNSLADTILLSKIKHFYSKSICPFCSIGCKTKITKQLINNQMEITSIKGDGASSLNYGEVCHKISNLPFKNDSTKIARIKTPLLKMKDGKYDKDGILTPISWQGAFDIMEDKAKKSLLKSGVNGVGLILSEQLSLYESYAISKFYKAGFRSNNILNLNYETENTSLANMQSYGIDGSNGNFNDIYHADVLVSYGIDFNNDLEIIHNKILNQKELQSNNFLFINIHTNKEAKNKKADINIFIKPNTEVVLLSFLIKECLVSLNGKDFDFLQNRTIFASINSNKETLDDKYEQWEVSYNTYTKYFEKYTIKYVANLIKDENEEQESFEQKLIQLASAYKNKSKNTLSYVESTKDKGFINIQLLLNSIHLLTDKHSKIGCGVMNFNSNTITSTSSCSTGNTSSRLPMGTFTKYKQHKERAEAIWHIPKNTLNTIALSHDDVFENIIKGVTKFVWCLGIPKNNSQLDDFASIENGCFFVASSTTLCEIPPFADLILPTTTLFEKHLIFENSQRELTFAKQQIVPFGSAMSELWQTMEFSKRFKLSDVWGEIQISNTFKLQSVLSSLKEFMFDNEMSLYYVLFENKKAQSYVINEKDFKDINTFNTEAMGDNRKTIGGNGLPFYGCNFAIQKYLFEELRLFGIGQGYDLASYEDYQNDENVDKKWPIVFGVETNYRFSSIDDPYAFKNNEENYNYVFYGKMGDKQLPFGDENKITNTWQSELKNRAKIFMIKEFND